MVRKMLVGLALVAVFAVAVAPAADAKGKSLRARVHALEKKQKADHKRLLEAEDAAGASLLMLSCFLVTGSDFFAVPVPGLVEPAFLFGASSAPDFPDHWLAVVDPSCVDTSGASSSARARLFRAHFPIVAR